MMHTMDVLGTAGVLGTMDVPAHHMARPHTELIEIKAGRAVGATARRGRNRRRGRAGGREGVARPRYGRSGASALSNRYLFIHQLIYLSTNICAKRANGER